MLLIEKAIWLGCAGVGFAILFNVPRRTLGIIYIIAAIGGMIKFLLIANEIGLVFSSLCGASAIGFISVLAAHYRKAPPMTFALPALIPMVPGMFAYNAMIGVIKLTSESSDSELYNKLFFETVNNGLKALFIILALSAGVAIPLLITRKQSVKRLKNDVILEIESENLDKGIS